MNEKNSSLSDWLRYIESIHPISIDLNLDRVRIITSLIGIKIDGIVFTVGGTNGKGSTCSFLEKILLESGYTVGLYTSPHIVSFNERFKINGINVSDNDIIDSLDFIDKVRGNISLTYFEFTTLAAIYLFSIKKLEVLIFEVGMGGRLDAVNIIDSDCSIVTNIGLDHVEWLGESRELIGLEKSHIYRKNKPAICGDISPPISLLDYVDKIEADFILVDRDFKYSTNDNNTWSYCSKYYEFDKLPYPKMLGKYQLLNVSMALTAIGSVKDRLNISYENISNGILNSFLPCRFQIIRNNPTIILDVAHNAHAANSLVANLADNNGFSKTHVVIGMLKDKNILEVVKILDSYVDYWYCCSTFGARGLSSDLLFNIIKDNLESANVICCPNVIDAFNTALQNSDQNDRILVFGSFLTVSDIYQLYLR
ncbi:dihydrofolate synthase/folylpolyglutamate synthase [Candidatus Kinetoplastibacterium oncopeltii TCC290E]|uniref:Dihydrofolate synthase/folylpolyglutamate synthase n=1 Tax=Candidatus Kinetoplastidibacterium stringomonadis TCC290E TaxID=1208920 RepID=M1L6W1_9PROT|nr:bifunctional tetrahydrofolate synthase/dihydrofolate synthase [Candidatus Kinetoplastibacterium oncopeltii]AGF48313.1 dihydrofolate synthase/folylpolyglutamate synthase [Candidatus Kinetoplastibacterium oncopeltii TCC290E]